ncbi:MAG: FliM/FliN family flagellar motor switch protein [Mesorhizobium sp.]
MAGSVRDLLPEPWSSRLSIRHVETPAAWASGDVARRWEWLDVEVQSPSIGSFLLVIGCERSSLVSLLLKQSIARAPIRSRLRDTLSVEASVSIGSLDMSLDELAGIGPGALVVMPEDADELRTVRVTDVTYQLRKIDDDWVCQSILETRQQGKRMGAEDAESAGLTGSPEANEDLSVGPATVRRGELPVTVDFDLNRLSLPISEVETWQGGTIVALDAPALAGSVSLTIRVNGVAVGSGELVRIDERLAVRIEQWSLE